MRACERIRLMMRDFSNDGVNNDWAYRYLLLAEIVQQLTLTVKRWYNYK
jgi:hypothetical protein